MCTGVEIAFIASAVAGAGGALGQGQAQQDALDINAKLARMQAKDAKARGKVAVDRLRADVRSLIGAQRVGFAGQNVLVDDGSALEIQADTARLGEKDALRLKNNFAREAWGYEVEALQFDFQAEAAAQAARTRAFTSLLSAGMGPGGGGFTFGNSAQVLGGGGQMFAPGPLTGGIAGLGGLFPGG
jgi:hypothetical protein